MSECLATRMTRYSTPFGIGIFWAFSMRSMFLFATLAMLCITAPAGAGEQGSLVPPSANGSVDSSVLLAAARSANAPRFLAVLNKVKTIDRSGILVSTLKEMWRLNNPDLDSQFLTRPIIRVKIADVLLQMHRNGENELDPDEYISYARTHVKSADLGVARQALLVLSIANRAEDVDLFKDILINSDESTYRAAALGFATNCAVDAQLVRRMVAALPSDRGGYLENVWSRVQVFRRCS